MKESWTLYGSAWRRTRHPFTASYFDLLTYYLYTDYIDLQTSQTIFEEDEWEDGRRMNGSR